MICGKILEVFKLFLDVLIYSLLSSIGTHIAQANPAQLLTIRLIVLNSQAGAVIGKQGTKIKEIRDVRNYSQEFMTHAELQGAGQLR